MSALYHIFRDAAGVSTDTRTLQSGELFFALSGPNFNGNEFAVQALDKGASAVIIDQDIPTTDERILRVDNSLKCLQELATAHRTTLGTTILALTGSNGKTTTKELIYAVLKEDLNTVATKGNLNNQIGVPLTLLSLKEDTEIGIVEMGANHPGEIALLASIAQPNAGLITNFGKAHLEGFGSLQGVVKAKSELYDFLKRPSGIIFANVDDSTSSQIRITAIPNSNDVIPVRNQILEIDFVNSTISSRSFTFVVPGQTSMPNFSYTAFTHSNRIFSKKNVDTSEWSFLLLSPKTIFPPAA